MWFDFEDEGRLDTLQNMRIFARVAECGSYTAAARRMEISTAYVSRSVSDLEAHLRTRLLNRTTRRIALTEAGARYLDRCRGILADINAAEREAADTHARPIGRLRIHATPSLGQYYVAPAAALYRERYPDVSIELTLGQEIPDLLNDGYDVTVQMTLGNLPDSGLVAHRLGTSYSVLCASRAYLERNSMPRDVDELRKHACVQVVTPFFSPDSWSFDGAAGRAEFALTETFFRVNNAEALSAALGSGIGIGALPVASALPALRAGSLIRVLPEYRLQTVTLHALYASRQYLDAKIGTWVELLRDAISVKLTAQEAELRDMETRRSCSLV